VAGVAEEGLSQPGDLGREDRRAGDEPGPPHRRAGPDRPEPAEFEAESETIAESLDPAEPSDVTDPGRFDRPDLPDVLE
jgi:hypothetical protein